MRTIVALYDDIRNAHAALVDLRDAGIPNENTSLVARDVDERYREYLDREPVDEAVEGAAIGASFGALIGGLGALLLSIGALAVPGVGPIVAAGPILAALTGGVTGAVAGGLVGALVDLGIPDTDAQIYAEGIRRGGTMLIVQAANHEVDMAIDILNRHDPVDIDRHAEYWREEGWTGYDEAASPYTSEQIEGYRTRYRTYNEAGMEAAARTGTDYWSDYEPEFRSHYQTTYASTGRNYAYYRPAYLYGCDLAANDRYRDYDWTRVEPEARRSWEERNGVGSWTEVTDAVHTSWNRCRAA